MLNINQIKQKIHILLNKKEVTELKTAQKREAKLAATKSIETFSSLNKKAKKLFDRIYANFDLKKEIVHNIIMYSKSLPKSGTMIIDQNVFEAQMKRHFHLTNAYMLHRIWEIISLGEQSCTLSCFVELVAIFLCGINDYKVQLVFKVYNFANDGYISRKDVEYFVRPMVVNISMGEDGSEDMFVKDFVNMLLSAIDRDGDERIELDEFRELASHNVLMMECLGPCLPLELDRQIFLRHLTDKTPTEAATLFRFERKISLQSAPQMVHPQGVQKHYPVPLEMP